MYKFVCTFCFPLPSSILARYYSSSPQSPILSNSASMILPSGVQGDAASVVSSSMSFLHVFLFCYSCSSLSASCFSSSTCWWFSSISGMLQLSGLRYTHYWMKSTLVTNWSLVTKLAPLLNVVHMEIWALSSLSIASVFLSSNLKT